MPGLARGLVQTLISSAGCHPGGCLVTLAFYCAPQIVINFYARRLDYARDWPLAVDSRMPSAEHTAHVGLEWDMSATTHQPAPPDAASRQNRLADL
jgi:hypothetical protein